MEIILILIYWIIRFTITYVIDTIPNSPDGYQHPSQVKNKCGFLLSIYKSQSNIKLNLMESSAIRLNVENTRSTSVLRKYLEEIWSIFDQFRRTISNIDVCLP